MNVCVGVRATAASWNLLRYQNGVTGHFPGRGGGRWPRPPGEHGFCLDLSPSPTLWLRVGQRGLGPLAYQRMRTEGIMVRCYINICFLTDRWIFDELNHLPKCVWLAKPQWICYRACWVTLKRLRSDGGQVFPSEFIQSAAAFVLFAVTHCSELWSASWWALVYGFLWSWCQFYPMSFSLCKSSHCGTDSRDTESTIVNRPDYYPTCDYEKQLRNTRPQTAESSKSGQKKCLNSSPTCFSASALEISSLHYS